MLFEPEAIERLSPDARVEVQDFYARRFLASRSTHVPERRGVARADDGAAARSATSANAAARPRWPRAVWFRNDSSRPGYALPRR
jgi:hypothetical protein